MIKAVPGCPLQTCPFLPGMIEKFQGAAYLIRAVNADIAA